jgi:organic hydroperoxide reductase OsmC/OhrA
MSEHTATIEWKRTTPDFDYKTYNRDHEWLFDAGISVKASASPDYHGSPSCVDPEEAFVASLAGCHMLTFLAICARKGLAPESYHDDAVGTLARDASGKLAITHVRLRPRVTFSGEKTPTADELTKLHDQAHHACFVASSVKSEMTIEPA